ncbi:MAG: leucine-rich repeat domain-containing protein, partial [Kiritimatiellae bacterium]|nr:leucine-rich repeat domain-containing protein [Kiritimatiellia bacterium]
MKKAIKAIVAVAAFVFAALTAQAEYIRPGITINGTTPTKDGTYSGYTYQDGVFTLTSRDATYTFAGMDTSGKVRIVAATGCKISLASGFKLDLTKFTYSSAYDAPKASPISLSTTDTVSVEALGDADLRAGNSGAGIRVTDGQSLILMPSRTSRMYVLGYVGAGIGGGYSENCGNIEIRGGHLCAQGVGDGSGIGDGGNAHAASHNSKITIGMSAHVEAIGGANAPGIGMTSYSVSYMEILITGRATVVASGSGRSAGIGVAWRSEGSCSVTINDNSTVTATGGTGGAGIGSATESTTSMQIYISNAKVTATGGADAAGIGGGNTSKTPTVWIMGGTVFAKGDPDVVSVNDIGAGRNPKTSATSSVTGGSVRLANGKGALTNDGTALSCVTVGGLAADGAVSVSLTTSKGTYGSSGIYADASGCIYLWAPPANYSIYVNDVPYTADARSGNAMAHSAQPPANDNFANAKVVSGASGRVGGSNVAATRESGLYVVTPTDTYNVDDTRSVWYSWTASFTGTVCFQAEVLQEDVESLGGRPDIEAYAGTSGSQLRYADDSSSGACDPEDEGFWGGRVRFNCTKGTTYKIKVYSYYGVQFPAFVLAWDTADKADSWVASFGSDGTAKLLRGRFDSGALVIPASLFGCRVTEIGESFGGARGDITSVTIPEGVTKIGNYAFERMGISSVTIPSTVTTIGNQAFSWCDSLKKVSIGSNVASIGVAAFVGCGNLESIVVPASVRTIGSNAFWHCTKLASVTYQGNQPAVVDAAGGQYGDGDNLYPEAPSTLVSIVPADDDTWSAALAAGTWMARPIRTAGAGYTVQFHKYDGSGATAEQTFKKGETKSLLWMDSQLH